MNIRSALRFAPLFPKASAAAVAVALAVTLAASPLAAASGAPATVGANTLDKDLVLNTAITVEGNAVTLGDVFTGYLSWPEKVVAQAPKPGQRLVLTAEQLTDIARTYGLDWQPSNKFDRAVVYQPGAVIATGDILGAIKDALIAQGMPENFGLAAATPLAPVTVALKAPTTIDVRETVFDAPSKTFSAVVQIPPNDPQAVFISVRGQAFPTVQVPVLKEGLGKNVTISAAMIDLIDVPEDQMKPATVTDANLLIGKTPKMFLRAGTPIRDSEITQITLVDVPVLAGEMDRDEIITKNHIKTISVNAASLPADAVTSAEFLVGKNPRRPLAAGAPIRRADVVVIRQREVPVAVRDIVRGTTLTEADITYVLMNEAEIVGEIAMDEAEIVGQLARLTLRAGQPVRKHAIGKATAVERGQLVTVMWSVATINLTAQGHAMEKGGVGDVIRVTNTKSKQAVLAEIIDSRTVRVAAPAQVSSR